MAPRADGLPTIGLAIIAKDEEENIGTLLDSVGWTDNLSQDESAVEDPEGGYWRPSAHVDFVVVCDTGSEDETKRVCELRGCRVVERPWTNDFSVARQASYDALPQVDFTLWADCDDVIKDASLLRQLSTRIPSFIAGTIHRYDYAQDPAGNCVCELWRERLVRYGVGEWKLPVHEVLDVGPNQLMHVEQVEWVHRAGQIERARDPERNYKILARHRREAEKKGEQADPRTLAYLGTEAMTLGRLGEGVDCFREYLQRPDAKWDEERCQVSHKLSICLRQLANEAITPTEEDPDITAEDREQERQLVAASEDAAVRAMLERPDWPDGYLDLAELCLRREEAERCLQFCDRAEALEPPRTLLITNPLEYAYQPLLMRSVALAKLGRNSEAFEATQRALALTPYREDLRLQLATIQVAVRQEEATSHFLALREILVRHDENEKARKLMECAPYFVWTNPQVAQARIDQREMTLHATDPEIYRSYYRTNPGEAPFEHTGIKVEEAHQHFHRLGMLREQLAAIAKGRKGGKAGLRILDLSCNDGWMLRNLAEAGFGTKGRLDGMDLNKGAAERAKRRLRGYPAEIVRDDLFNAGEHFTGTYDAVVCFETIEHVPDPAALLDQMVKLTKKSGLFFISTPDGAFEQGNIAEWAKVESKGHLRAMRSSEVADLLCTRGVVESFETQQGLIAACARPLKAKKRIHLYVGPSEALPEKVLGEGLGGSETAVCKLAEHFSRRGHDVRVFTGEGFGGLRGDYVTAGQQKRERQVLYQPAADWDPAVPCDLFIAVRMPQIFDVTIAAKERVLWLHDHEYGALLTEERAKRTTGIVVMSDFQRELLTETYPFLADANLIVSRNGIETAFFEEEPGRKKPWLVFSSSPDRGLDVLLELWPEIRDRAVAAGVKKPELHHTYAPVYAQFRDAYPHLQAFHARVQELELAAGEGVVAHDHMGQLELAELFSTAMVWAYPSWNSWTHGAFPEISCISAMEAQAAGCVPVYTDYAALKETVAAGLPVPLDISRNGDEPHLSDNWREAFIVGCVRALTKAEFRREVKRRARPYALKLDWSGVADDWEREFRLRPSARRAKVKAS